MDTRRRAIERFQALFGHPPEFLTSAPGRVNLIGEHTDYNEGFVLPIAVDRRLYIAAKRRDDMTVRVTTVDLNDEDEFSLTDLSQDKERRWRNYLRGVAWVLRQKGLSLSGMDALIVSDIPMEAGLSSSAALEVAIAMAFLHMSGKELPPKTVAQWCQKAENEFVGVQCGVMDQMIAVLGKAGHALLLDCRDLSYRHIHLPSPIQFLVADTRMPRSLAASEYNVRRQQCEEAVRLLSQMLERPIKSLRDVTPEELHIHFYALPDPIGRRARHVVWENARVLDFAKALGEGHLRRAGFLLLASHASLRDDYEVSTKELDAMVLALQSFPGVLGARLTGAGFGGACIAMVRKEAVPEVLRDLPHRYAERLSGGSPEPIAFVVQASDGARVERL